jgi:DNA (cytosine-5)-methyltransferase 1
MTNQMKVLNLYAGIGGNRKLWQDVEVTAVEYNEKIAGVYSELYPNDKVIIGDAHGFLLKHYSEFDFIWSSPTCQSHSRMNKFTRHNTIRYADMGLYQEIILLKEFFKGKWVVENVQPYYEPLIKARKVGRHLFWSNFPIMPFDLKTPKNFTKLATLDGKQKMMDWLGIHFEQNIYYEGNHCPVQVLRNAVHPLLGKHIMDCATGVIQVPDLFNAA